MGIEIFMGTMMIFMMSLVFIIILGLFIFWVWTIIDVAKREFTNSNERLIWLLLLILLGFIPSIVYYIIVMQPDNNGVMREGKEKKENKKRKK